MLFKALNNWIFSILKNLLLLCMITIYSNSSHAVIKIGISSNIKCKLEIKNFRHLQYYRKYDSELVQDFVSINADIVILSSNFFEIIRDDYKYVHFKIYAHGIKEGKVNSIFYIVLAQENAFNYSTIEKNEFLKFLSKQNCFSKNSSLKLFPDLNPNMVLD